MNEQAYLESIDLLTNRCKEVLTALANSHDQNKYYAGINNDLETCKFIRIFLAPMKRMDPCTFEDSFIIEDIGSIVSSISSNIGEIGCTFQVNMPMAVSPVSLSEIDMISTCSKLVDLVDSLIAKIRVLKSWIMSRNSADLTPEQVIIKMMINNAKEFVINECVKPGTCAGYVTNKILEFVRKF